eukprot:566442-Pelagomonas_calceolata.AAC.5
MASDGCRPHAKQLPENARFLKAQHICTPHPPGSWLPKAAAMALVAHQPPGGLPAQRPHWLRHRGLHVYVRLAQQHPAPDRPHSHPPHPPIPALHVPLHHHYPHTQAPDGCAPVAAPAGPAAVQAAAALAAAPSAALAAAPAVVQAAAALAAAPDAAGLPCRRSCTPPRSLGAPWGGQTARRGLVERGLTTGDAPAMGCCTARSARAGRSSSGVFWALTALHKLTVVVLNSAHERGGWGSKQAASQLFTRHKYKHEEWSAIMMPIGAHSPQGSEPLEKNKSLRRPQAACIKERSLN